MRQEKEDMRKEKSEKSEVNMKESVVREEEGNPSNGVK